MELSQRDRLSQLVEELTTSGQPQLHQDKMKEVKKICRVSDDCIDHVYHSVMSQLNQEHAEIRLSAFQVASELFSRSHRFRTLLVDNFQEFLELTVETDSEQPLPPPKEVARKLRLQAVQAVQAWQTSYGSAYKKLALGYHFLKQVKKVDFQDASARTVTERRREEERQRKMDRIYRERVEAATRDMEESHQEIEATLTEMESCMELLFPSFGFTENLPANDSPPNSQPANDSVPNSQPANDSVPNSQPANDSVPNSQPANDSVPNSQPANDSVPNSQPANDSVPNSQPANDSVPNSQPANENASDGEQPCCSRELRDSGKDGQIHKREQSSRKDEEDESGTEEEEDSSEEEEEEEEEEDSSEGQFIRSSGLMSHSYSLDLNLSPGLHLKETEDNEPVVSTVIDLLRLITSKHLPAVQGWIQVFTKSGADQVLLRRALDMKKSLEAALQKHQELHIDYKTRVRRVVKAADEDDDDDDDDDDFDEVPEKEGYEPHIPEHLRAEYGLDPSPSTSAAPLSQKTTQTKRPAPPPASSSSSSSSISKRLKRLFEEEQDPTSAMATLRLLRKTVPPPTEASSDSSGPSAASQSAASQSAASQSAASQSAASQSAASQSAASQSAASQSAASQSAASKSSSEQKAPEAPVVPFGLDLYYWGQEQPNAGKIVKAASQHQFWVPCEVEEEVESQELLAQSKTRYISFPGTFTPVSHSCRAPLGNGTLCPRQDRLKCPFHGRIVPRDDDGRPCRREDRAREEKEERRRREQEPEWRDVELMRDIEAATGEDLGSDRVPGKKGKRKKKKKYPNLSDLKQSTNTSRCRLEKKVFNKSSMRRMAQVMNKADRRKHEKFSNQFNYALN